MANSRDQLWQESSEWEGVPKSIRYGETTKGTPYMEVTFNVDGHSKTAKFWMTERSIDSTLIRLKDLGFNGNFDSPQLTRTTPVRLSCKHNEYNGKWYEEWTFWGDKQAASPIDRSKAAQFAAQYKNVVGHQVASPAPTPRPTTPPAPKIPTPAPAPVPADPTKVAKDEQSAWEYWVNKTTDEKLRNEGWLATVAEINPKTEADWNRVALAVDIPF